MEKGQEATRQQQQQQKTHHPSRSRFAQSDSIIRKRSTRRQRQRMRSNLARNNNTPQRTVPDRHCTLLLTCR